MNLFVLFGTVSVLAVAVVWVIRRMLVPVDVTDCTAEWLEEFSIEKYRPMLRLLDQADYDFLAMQPGHTAQTVRKLRRERRRIFRAYLRSLSADFHRLQMTGKMVLVYATEDRSDLAAKLTEQRFRFMVAMLQVQMHLALHTLGIGTVDVRKLLGAVEGLRTDLASAQA